MLRFFLIAIASILFASPSVGGSMQVGPVTSQPIGHYDFCKRHPKECAVRPQDQRVLTLTDASWNLLVAVNRQVNAAVRPMSDFDIYGADEVWTYPTNGVGDCEDYVLEKRRRLHKKGISLANLLITVVRKRDGEGHAVLTVRTDKGEFILDNLIDEVRPWRKTRHKYLKRQDSFHTGKWVKLNNNGFGNQLTAGN